MSKKGYTHIAVVLDSSGSMQQIKKDTIGGFNSFLGDQKNTEGTATFTLTQFDTTYRTVYNMSDIEAVEELNEISYRPSGGTALFDAICTTIDTVGEQLHKMRESQKPEKVIVVILTDGEENSSRKFFLEDVKAKIKHQTDVYGWEFVFLGANQDAMESARSFNIDASRAMTYTASAASVNNVFLGMSKKLSNVRGGFESNMAYTTAEREEQEKLNNK